MLAYSDGSIKEDNLKKAFVPQLDLNMLNDMTGTRLLRCGMFKEAITYLEAVPNAWTQEQEFYAYMSSRGLNDVEPFRRAKYAVDVESNPTDQNIKVFKFRKFNLLISDCKIERYEPFLQIG